MHFARRHFLKTTGAALALPWMESLGGFAHASGRAGSPERLLLVCLPLGIYRDALIPAETGAGYRETEYLAQLGAFRDRLTILSGLEHPGVNGGHSAEPRIFTGVPSHHRNARSLDQYLAGHIGRETRFDSLALSAGRNEFSWTDSGTKVPAHSKMARVYAELFLDPDRRDTDRTLREIGRGRSIMEMARGQARALQPRLSATDREKLEEYFESVGETERRLVKSEGWVHMPKPKVDEPAPKDPSDRGEILTQMRNVCDITHLAFKTDSTRVITFGWFEQNKVNIDGVRNGYHSLSHHGRDPGNIAQLKLIEAGFFKELNRLLGRLQATREGDATLLDRTTIVVTSNLGNASNHSNRDLPVLLIGGRHPHGRHLAYEPGSTPLCNLYLHLLHQFGLADRSFGSSTGSLKELA